MYRFDYSELTHLLKSLSYYQQPSSVTLLVQCQLTYNLLRALCPKSYQPYVLQLVQRVYVLKLVQRSHLDPMVSDPYLPPADPSVVVVTGTELPLTELPLVEVPLAELPLTELPLTELPLTELPLRGLTRSRDNEDKNVRACRQHGQR